MQQRTTRQAPAAVLSAVTVLIALVLTGCTASITGNPVADPAPAPTEGPGSDPVLWVDRVCGSLMAFTGPTLSQPRFDDAPDLPGIKRKLDDYLKGIVDGLQQSRNDLGTVGRSPVGGGDQAVARVGDVLEKLQNDITTARTKVDEADPGNPQGFLDTISDAEKQLGQISAPDVLAEITAVPRLKKAASKAANCQQLSAQTAAPAK